MRRCAAIPMLSVLVALAAFAPASAQEGKGKKKKIEAPQKPFLWIVEGGDLKAPSFLYGTIHLPDDRVTALSKVVEAAIDRCDGLFTELPMDPQSQQAMAPLLMRSDGKTISGTVPKELLDRVAGHLKAKGLQVAMFDRFKLWVLTTQLGTLDYLQAQMMGKQPLDAVVYSRAQKAGKEVGGVEKVEEQLGVFDALTEEEQLLMLKDTLDGLDKAKQEGKRPTDALVDAWLEGAEDKVLDLAADDMQAAESKEMNEKFMKLLLEDRNVTMATRIDEKLKADPNKSYFFAFGTMHFPGDKGVNKLLEAKGYKIRRLTQADAAKIKK